jgi:hypothetical protein
MNETRAISKAYVVCGRYPKSTQSRKNLASELGEDTQMGTIGRPLLTMPRLGPYPISRAQVFC